METRDDRWIQTFTGRAFWPLDPDPSKVDIFDIAQSLACNNRFNGHTIVPYSVAQHSVIVSQICDPADALYGLLHDASEAYIHDIVRPIKLSVQVDGRPYAEAEDRVMRAILNHYGLDLPLPESVIHADNVALVMEKRDLMAPCEREWHRYDITPLAWRVVAVDWKTARSMFMDRFEELTRKAA